MTLSEHKDWLEKAPHIAAIFLAEFVGRSRDRAEEDVIQNTQDALDRLLDPDQTSKKDHAAYNALSFVIPLLIPQNHPEREGVEQKFRRLKIHRTE